MILKRRQPDKPPKRDNNRSFYQSARWHAFSRAYRKRNPLCQECLKQGISKLAECVDHIKPIAEGGALYDLTNLQSLCNPCHSKKTASENKHWNKHE